MERKDEFNHGRSERWQFNRIWEEVGSILAMIRSDRGLTQTELARRISAVLERPVSQSKISRCENNSRPEQLDASEFFVALEALNCTLEEFYKWLEVTATSKQLDDEEMLREVATDSRHQQRESLRERLQAEILTRSVAPGNVYQADELSARYGWSKDVVMKVLRQLAGDRLVECFDERAIVTDYGPQFVKSVLTQRATLEKRIALEILAQDEPTQLCKLQNIHARMCSLTDPDDCPALADLDVEFHACLASLAGRGEWAATIGQLVRAVIVGSPPIRVVLADVISEHQRIIDFLRTRNQTKLLAAISAHLTAAANRWYQTYLQELEDSVLSATITFETQSLNREKVSAEQIYHETVAEIARDVSKGGPALAS